MDSLPLELIQHIGEYLHLKALVALSNTLRMSFPRLERIRMLRDVGSGTTLMKEGLKDSDPYVLIYFSRFRREINLTLESMWTARRWDIALLIHPSTIFHSESKSKMITSSLVDKIRDLRCRGGWYCETRYPGYPLSLALSSSWPKYDLTLTGWIARYSHLLHPSRWDEAAKVIVDQMVEARILPAFLFQPYVGLVKVVVTEFWSRVGNATDQSGSVRDGK